MAEQDFIISIRTTADTAGIKATEAELRNLGVQVESIQKAGAATGAGGIGGISRATIFGTSAVGVGLALKNVIEGIGEQQLRISQELDKQLAHLTKLSQKWADTASSARTQADVDKLALSTLTELEAAQKRMNDYQNAGVGFTKEWADTILSVIQLMGGPRLGGIFGKAFEEQANRLAENVTLTRQAAIAAADLALEYKDAFDAEKVKPFDEAVASVIAKIEEAERAQAEAGTKNIERYTEQGRKVQQYNAQLAELIKLEEQRRQEAEETRRSKEEDREFDERQQTRAASKFEELRRGLPAPSNAAGFLRNMEAAERARREGDTKGADLLEKTAQQLKEFSAGPSRRAIEELERLKREAGPKLELNETNQILRDIREAWR